MSEATNREVGSPSAALHPPGPARAALDAWSDALVELAPVGLAVVDAEGRILMGNPALAETLGCRDVDHLMSTPAQAFHAMPDLATDILRDHLDHGVVRAVEMELLRLDGREIFVRLSAQLVPDEHRGTLAFCFVEDATRDREAREESSQGQKMEAVVRFAAGVAHDYNNLLTAIIGEARQLLADAEPASEVADGAGAILRTARRAGAITRRLLTFSRAEVSRPEVFPLNQALDRLRPRIEKLLSGEVEIAWRLDEEVRNVRIDPAHLEQILTQLVSNARDAMPGGGRLAVETSRMAAPGDTEGLDFHPPVRAGSYLSLAVGDTGIGMNPETRRRVFDPFFSTKGRGNGTGLGLTTVYGLVQRAGGHISVISAPAYGTLVRVLLPPSHEAATDRRPYAPARRRVTPQTTARILVVDDEPSVRRVMVKILRRAGYDLVEASDGFAAQTVLAEEGNDIDLLVTDVMMPRMKGTDLALWCAEARPHIPVLLVSGYNDSELLQEWVDRDRDIFLAKPFEPEELLDRVRARLGE